MAMESTTLVIVLFPARGLTSPQLLVDALHSTASKYFSRRGWDSLLGSRITFDDKAPQIWGAVDKTLLGSLTEMIRLAKYELENDIDDLSEAMDSTNWAPLSAIGMEAPMWILDKLVGKKLNYKPIY
jgi:hypothetical protein